MRGRGGNREGDQEGAWPFAFAGWWAVVLRAVLLRAVGFIGDDWVFWVDLMANVATQGWEGVWILIKKNVGVMYSTRRNVAINPHWSSIGKIFSTFLGTTKETWRKSTHTNHSVSAAAKNLLSAVKTSITSQ